MKFSNHTFFRAMFIVVIALFATACNTTRADLSSNLLDDRQVFVRLINSTSYDIDAATLGHQYIKPNSYSRTTYHTNYRGLSSGKVTRYKQVPNVTIGHRLLRLENIGTEIPYKTVNLIEQIAQSAPAYLSEVQWVHPYSKEIKTDLGFIEGKFTVELLSITKNQNGYDQVNVIITRDE